MADDNTPIEGSPADTTDVTASTHTSTHAFASTPPLNTSSIRSFKAATTSTKPAPAPISVSATTSSRKRLRRITVATTLTANKQDKNQDTSKPATKRTWRKKTI